MTEERKLPDEEAAPMDYDPIHDACQATAESELRRQIMDSRVPKNEREWWAAHEIERLREIVTAPLSPVELKLVDKHCAWVAFKQAWNAVMKRRQEAVHGDRT